MPNRIIRDAILDSEKYDALQIEARLAFFEILLRADDYGLIPLHNLWLRRHCPVFDGRSVEFADGVLCALADQDLIRVYEVDGRRYAFIPQFGNRPQALKPKYPVPPVAIGGDLVVAMTGTSKNGYRRDRLAIFARDSYRCFYCGGEFVANQLHIDHKVAVANGGTNDVTNLVTACAKCNMAKGFNRLSLNAPIQTLSESPEYETETETEVQIQKKKIRAPRAASPPSAAPSGVSPEVWNDFKTLRAKHKAPITPTAMAGIEREADKAGLTLEDALRTCCERSWRGFKADWLVDTSGNGKTPYGRSGKPEEPSRYARPGLMAKMKELERKAIEAREREHEGK